MSKFTSWKFQLFSILLTFHSTLRFLDENQLSPGSNGSSMMGNPSGNNGAGTSWLFSGPNSGGGFHDPGLHGNHNPGAGSNIPTSNATFTPSASFEDGRQPPMIPFSQTDLNFVDSLTIHPSQQKTQQQQHFVTSSTLHPSLSVVEATDATGKTDFCYNFSYTY